MSRPISVVIAAKNAEETLSAQLDALVSQPWPNGGEIIVADNGSTDATPRIVRDFTNSEVSISLVDCAEIAGAGHARNCGVQASAHQYIGFCDADDVVANDWVSAMTDALDTHCAVGGRLHVDMLNPSWAVGSRGQSLDADELPKFDGIFSVLSSCNLGIHRSTFLEFGGFDESYVRGQDAEFSLRLHQAGVSTHFARDVVVNYRLRTSIKSIYSQALGWGAMQQQLRARLGENPRIRSTLRSWIWLGVNAHLLFRRSGRARWAYVAGTRAGVLRANIDARRRGRS